MGNEPVLKYLLYSLSFPLCFIKSIINGLLKQIYSKDINSWYRTVCHLFICANGGKRLQCSSQKERMKNKENPVFSITLTSTGGL